MTAATASYTALQNAMTSVDPACAGNDLFILDDVPAEVLKPICEACPLYELCTAYAQTARPTGGIWAGRRWNRTERKGK